MATIRRPTEARRLASVSASRELTEREIPVPPPDPDRPSAADRRRRRTRGLVIFDCDGVLVDSEPIANRILAEMLTDLAVPTSTEEAMRAYVGLSWPSCVARIEARRGLPLPESFGEDFRRRCRTAFAAELAPIPGIRTVLETLRWPSCVASSGDPEKIRTSLRLAGLCRFFGDRIFSASDVARPKPYPDLFLHAAAAMRTAPEVCVVVEDTVVGVRAAAAAGMAVLGLAGTMAASDLRAAGARVVHNACELPALFAALLPPR